MELTEQGDTLRPHSSSIDINKFGKCEFEKKIKVKLQALMIAKKFGVKRGF